MRYHTSRASLGVPAAEHCAFCAALAWPPRYSILAAAPAADLQQEANFSTCARAGSAGLEVVAAVQAGIMAWSGRACHSAMHHLATLWGQPWGTAISDDYV